MFGNRWGAVTAVRFPIQLAASRNRCAYRGQTADASVRELGSQVNELRAMIEKMRAENAQSQVEMRELREELQDTRKLLTPLVVAIHDSRRNPRSRNPQSPGVVSAQTDSGMSSSDLTNRVQQLEESTQLIGSKVDEQYQTKVETAAKYRARLSGIVLMNLFRT